jgi:hypothetical protein
VVDIIYIGGKPFLYIVDKAIRFQVAKWLDNIFAKYTWDVLKIYWIDVYIGLLDYIVYNIGINFVSKEFVQIVVIIVITIKSILIEVY